MLSTLIPNKVMKFKILSNSILILWKEAVIVVRFRPTTIPSGRNEILCTKFSSNLLSILCDVTFQVAVPHPLASTFSTGPSANPLQHLNAVKPLPIVSKIKAIFTTSPLIIPRYNCCLVEHTLISPTRLLPDQMSAVTTTTH